MPDIFEKQTTPRQQILTEATEGWEVERIEYGNGINVYVKGAEFPHKGLPSPEAIWAINLVKKSLIGFLQVLSHPVFWPSLILVPIIPKRKLLQTSLEAFNRLGTEALSSYFLQHQYQTKASLEFGGFIYNFLKEIVPTDPAEQTAKILSHVIEYDSAYRFRLQDLFSSTSKEKLQYPFKELRRLNKINSERELGDWGRLRMNLAITGVSILLLSPSLKRAYRKAVERMNITNLQFDQGDLYWIAFRQDYLYNGLTYEQRQAWLKEMNYKVPNVEIL
jgi:hypothetical protein